MSDASSPPIQQPSELVLQQLYRLFKLALFHDLRNEAVARAIENAVVFFKHHITPDIERLNVLFAGETVFIDGELLRANKAAYQSAMELSEVLDSANINQIEICPGVAEADIRKALFAFVAKFKERASAAGVGTAKFRLKHASSAILFGDDDELTTRQQLAKAYAYAVVAMRRLFEGVKDGNYIFSRHVKRLAQRLAMLADEDAHALIGLTSTRDANNDEAGRSVNCAILAVAMARLINRDLRFLSRVALAAMLYDIGLPRAAGMGRPDPHRMTPAIPRLNEPQQARVPACSALVMTALGRLTDESLQRTCIGYESQWLNRQGLLGPLYGGDGLPALESQLVSIVWRFNRLVTYDIWAQGTLTVDDAIFVMSRDARSDIERILIDMLLSAMGLFPSGTLVRLSSGWSAVVTHNPDHPALFSRPHVQLVIDPDGTPHPPDEVDLYAAHRQGRKYGHIAHLLSTGPQALLRAQSTVFQRSMARHATMGLASKPAESSAVSKPAAKASLAAVPAPDDLAGPGPRAGSPAAGRVRRTRKGPAGARRPDHTPATVASVPKGLASPWHVAGSDLETQVPDRPGTRPLDAGELLGRKPADDEPPPEPHEPDQDGSKAQFIYAQKGAKESLAPVPATRLRRSTPDESTE